MQSSLPSGIRSTGDLRYDDLVRSVRLMNECCESKGSRFFLSTSDGDTFDVAGMHLMGLYGWVVPIGEAESFEKEWMAGADFRDRDFGGQWYQAIVWEDRDGVATPVFLKCYE